MMTGLVSPLSKTIHGAYNCKGFNIFGEKGKIYVLNPLLKPRRDPPGSDIYYNEVVVIL
uniref:Uncharacterized protein n=1 Tax=Lepeophtheirus salmonis TaxID=72036 RepID=A0A0K2SV51_LEPSM